jgi:hypothetical protein
MSELSHLLNQFYRLSKRLIQGNLLYQCYTWNIDKNREYYNTTSSILIQIPSIVPELCSTWNIVSQYLLSRHGVFDILQSLDLMFHVEHN